MTAPSDDIVTPRLILRLMGRETGRVEHIALPRRCAAVLCGSSKAPTVSRTWLAPARAVLKRYRFTESIGRVCAAAGARIRQRCAGIGVP
jgi:hypothetical protein